MPLIDDNDVIRVDLPGAGEWVELKRQLSKGDEIAVAKAGVKGARQSADGEVEVDFEEALEAGTFAAVDLAIRAWSFAVPVTPENIRKLDRDSYDVIKAKLDELNPARDDEEKKASPSNSSPRLTAVDSGRRASLTSA